MKTIEEIRSHRNDLLKAIEMPCDCAESGHAFECESGALMMRASVRTLSWVLGEDDSFQAFVDTIATGVRYGLN